MASITFEKAQRWYPGSDRPAVPGIDLEIRDGEFMVLVGPSGCGKSTTLRMLAGLEEVNSGHIYIGDKEVTNLPPKERDIAMVFQNYALYPHMSVADNMAFALKLAKVPDAERKERVGKAAELLGLTETEAEILTQLGPGQALWQVGRRSFVVQHYRSRLEAQMTSTDEGMIATRASSDE